MEYVSREDARSDLMMAGAVFVFGPFALRLLFGVVGLHQLGGTTGQLLQIAVIVACTALVPVLLMRYRQETPARTLGLGGGDPTMPTAVLAAVPLLLVGVAELTVVGVGAARHPLMLLLSGEVLGLVARTVAWVGVLGLALYVTVKARDAFGGEPVSVEAVVWRIGRVLIMVAGAATALLAIPALIQGVEGVYAAGVLVLWPLAVAATVALIVRRGVGVGTTTLPTLLAPTIIGAVGNFVLSLFSPAALFLSIYQASLSGGLGLGVGVLAERSRRGGGALVLALLIALASSLPAPLRLG